MQHIRCDFSHTNLKFVLSIRAQQENNVDIQPNAIESNRIPKSDIEKTGDKTPSLKLRVLIMFLLINSVSIGYHVSLYWTSQING